MSAQRKFLATPSLNAYAGPWNIPVVRHLLRRTLFGVKRSDVSYFKSLGLTGSVNQLLDDSAPMPAPPVKEYNSSTAAIPDNLVAAGQTWVNDSNTDGTVAFLRRASLKKWWVGNMINQERNLREKMTLFWLGHFVTSTNDDHIIVFSFHTNDQPYLACSLRKLLMPDRP